MGWRESLPAGDLLLATYYLLPDPCDALYAILTRCAHPTLPLSELELSPCEPSPSADALVRGRARVKGTRVRGLG